MPGVTERNGKVFCSTSSVSGSISHKIVEKSSVDREGWDNQKAGWGNATSSTVGRPGLKRSAMSECC